MWSKGWGQKVPRFGCEITRWGQRVGFKRVGGSGTGRDGGGTEAGDGGGGETEAEAGWRPETDAEAEAGRKKQNLHQGVRKNKQFKKIVKHV